MSGAVLDASAVIALLQKETGAEKVAEIAPEAVIGAVNFAEVVGHFARRGVEANAVDATLRALSLEVIPADIGIARSAGRMRAMTEPAGLSLGDRFCLALALELGLPAYTADRQWAALPKAVGVKVVLIR